MVRKQRKAGVHMGVEGAVRERERERPNFDVLVFLFVKLFPIFCMSLKDQSRWLTLCDLHSHRCG